MSSQRNSDSWKEVIAWCSMMDWTYLWLSGDHWLQELMLRIPKLNGVGYYSPMLRLLTGLVDLDLTIDQLLPITWLTQLPIHIHTLSLCWDQRSTNLQQLVLPDTLTSLSMKSSGGNYKINLGTFPLSLTKLHIEDCEKILYSPVCDRPVLLSLSITGPYNYGATSVASLVKFLSSAPSLTSYTGFDCDIFLAPDGIIPFPSTEQIKELNINSTYQGNGRQVVDLSTLNKFEYARVTLLSDHRVLSHTLRNITALTLLSLMDDTQVQFLPDTLTFLRVSPYHITTATIINTLGSLPSLEELDLTANKNAVHRKFTAGDFPKLRKLTLQSFSHTILPPSVTSFTVLGIPPIANTVYSSASRTSLTVPESGSYQYLSGLVIQQLTFFNPNQLTQLTSLDVHGDCQILPLILDKLPTGILRKLTINERSSTSMTHFGKVQPLITACVRFTKLELLHISFSVQSLDMEFEYITAAITFPSTITHLSLRLYSQFTDVTLPPSMSKFSLTDTVIPIMAFGQLKAAPLHTFILRGKIDKEPLLRVMRYLPLCVSDIDIIQREHSSKILVDDPLIMEYRKQRWRYLSCFTLYAE